MNKADMQVLIATMEMEDEISLLRKMNIQTDFIIGNQTNINYEKRIEFNGKKGLIIGRDNIGVGRNRNELINYASAEICIFADDDMVFCNNYQKIVMDTFLDNKNTDIIIFNLEKRDKESYFGERENRRQKKIGYLNYMNYGAARIAFRRSAISYAGIFFNVNFGGGTKHQCGEDSLFLNSCIRAGLTIEAMPLSIARVENDRESSWFKGYTKEYFFDKGVFLALAHPYFANIFAEYLILRHKEYLKNDLSKNMIREEIQKGIRFIKRKEYENI